MIAQLKALEGFESFEEHTVLSGTAGFCPIQNHLSNNSTNLSRKSSQPQLSRFSKPDKLNRATISPIKEFRIEHAKPLERVKSAIRVREQPALSHCTNIEPLKSRVIRTENSARKQITPRGTNYGTQQTRQATLIKLLPHDKIHKYENQRSLLETNESCRKQIRFNTNSTQSINSNGKFCCKPDQNIKTTQK